MGYLKKGWWTAALLVGLLTPVLAYAAGGMGNMKMDAAGAETSATQQNVGTCPVTGAKASPKYHYQYKGKTYYFCCASCIAKFKKNPEKYINKTAK